MNSTNPTSVPSLIETRQSYTGNYDQKENIRENIENFIKDYWLDDIDDLSTAFEPEWGPYEVNSEFKQIEAMDVPKWFAKQISQGHIAAFFISLLFTKETFFDCQVEDFDQPSSYTCGRKIRQLMYSIMFKGIESEKIVISEYDRSQKQEGKCQVVKIPLPIEANINDMHIPSLSEIAEMEDKRQFLFDALGLESTVQFSSIFQLVLTAMMYWKKSSGLGINELHIAAILLCMIKSALNGEEVMSDKQPEILGYPVTDPQNMFQIRKRLFLKTGHFTQVRREFDIGIIHAFAEFQALLRDVMYLNELLQYPLQPVCPSRVFNGVFLYNAYCELQSHDTPKMYMCELLGNLSEDLKTLMDFLDMGADQSNDDT